MDKKHCAGCTENFYNGNNPYGIAVCWHLRDAKLRDRFQLSTSTPMNIRRAYVPMRKPGCYRAKGAVMLDKIPSYAE